MRQPATFSLFTHKLTLEPGFLLPEAQLVETFLLTRPIRTKRTSDRA